MKTESNGTPSFRRLYLKEIMIGFVRQNASCPAYIESKQGHTEFKTFKHRLDHNDHDHKVKETYPTKLLR
jgi:hypothetical protein